MIYSPLAVAADGYLYPGPSKPLSIASSGYLSLVIIEEVIPTGGGGSARVRPNTYTNRMARLHNEDNEMLSMFMLATIYRMME